MQQQNQHPTAGSQDSGLSAETRKETWYITDQYLSAAIQLTVRQFVDDPEQWQPPTKDRLKERINRLLELHSPVAYNYFLHLGEGKIAFGTYHIIVQEVRKQRPLFASAIWKH